MKRLVAYLALFSWASSGLATPKVVTSIMPVHSLVAAVMQGIGEPVLVVSGYASPHTHQLRPSEAQDLDRADVVFWIGPALETFLARALLESGKAIKVSLMDLDGLNLLANRDAGSWLDQAGASTEDTDSDSSQSRALGSHIWLDPGNAQAMVTAVGRILGEVDPANASRYQRNVEATVARISALDEEIVGMLAPVRGVPYIVLHDAYHYFEVHYQLSAVGAVTVSPDQMPSAKRIKSLRKAIEQAGVRCVFHEPQLESALVDLIREGFDVGVGVLDPLGAALPPGPDAYFELMRYNAIALRECLGGS